MVTETIRSLVKSLDQPDETKEFSQGRLHVVDLGDTGVVRMVLQPGWRWSKDIKPHVDMESCTVPHLQYVVSGRLRVRMDNGTEFELKPCDVALIPSGHDAWVVGDEPFVAVDFSPEMRECARKF
jgi:quercetin dioxygenase-like cupin family protein